MLAAWSGSSPTWPRPSSSLARQPDLKPGNSNKFDPCQNAKRSFLLGQLVARRDRVEAKHFAWQRWAERFNRWLTAVRGWKGVKLPYTMGALDVWLGALPDRSSGCRRLLQHSDRDPERGQLAHQVNRKKGSAHLAAEPGGQIVSAPFLFFAITISGPSCKQLTGLHDALLT